MPGWSTGSAGLMNLASSSVDQLPVELWKRFVQSLRPDSREIVKSFWDSADSECEVAALLSDQARFHQLKLVCSKFYQVFLQHPELSAEVFLPKDSASDLRPSLILWLRRFGESVSDLTQLSSLSIELASSQPAPFCVVWPGPM